MMCDFQLAVGDVCADSTGLRVRVEDIDTYDYVHFSVIGKSLVATSRQAQTLERGASGSATRIRHNGQFEYGNV
jgi:hypothetical protein